MKKQLNVVFAIWLTILSTNQFNYSQQKTNTFNDYYDSYAKLPTRFADVFPATIGGTVYTVSSGSAADLQSKLTTAASNCGSTGVTVVVPVATYTSTTQFNIPPNNCTGSAWYAVLTQNLSALRPLLMTRIDCTADAANLPTLTNSDLTYPVLNISDNPSTPPKNIWIDGFNITSNYPNSGSNQLALFVAGDGAGINSGHSAANFADHITIARSCIHGANINSNVLHGIRFTARHFQVLASVIDEIHKSDSSSQPTGISSDFSYGPVNVINNTVAAVSENFIFGGADPPISGLVTADIYIGFNYIYRPTAWFSVPLYAGEMRNFIECKNCERLLVEHNAMNRVNNNSVSSALQFTPRNPGGACTWCVVQDVTIRYNYMREFSDAVSILGANGMTVGGSQGPELPSQRFSIHDNEMHLNRGGYTGNGRWFQLTPGDASATGCSATPNTDACRLKDISIVHNTLISTDSNTVWTLAGTPTSNDKGVNLIFADNVVPAGSNLMGNDTGSVHPLTGAFGAYFSSYTVTGNAIWDISGAGYSEADFPSPICNFSNQSMCPGPGMPASSTAVKFVNFAGGDYRLCQATGLPTSCGSGASGYGAAGGTTNKNVYGIDSGANLYSLWPEAEIIAGRYKIGTLTAFNGLTDEMSASYTFFNFAHTFAGRVSDGSGKADYSGFYNGNAYSVRAGFNAWWNTLRDPAMVHNIGGFDSGISSKDLVSSATNCGFTGASTISDSKGFWGQVSIVSQNKVLLVVDWNWPLIGNLSTHLPPTNPPDVFGRQRFYISRPGKIAEHFAFDNNCGMSIAMDTFNYNQNNAWYTFVQVPNTSQYPPLLGVGWNEAQWQMQGSYDPDTKSPWGGYSNTSGIVHSVTGGTVVGGQGVNPGAAQLYGDTSTTFAVQTGFTLIPFNATAVDGSHLCTQGVGCRSYNYESGLTIPASGTNSLVRYSLQLAGEFGINDLTTMAPYATEFKTPSTPTTSVGSFTQVNYDGFVYEFAASGGAVNITTTGDMYCPILRVTNYNATPPATISVGGDTLSDEYDYISDNENGTDDLILQLGLKGYDNSCSVIPSGTNIVIGGGVSSANSLTSAGTKAAGVKY